MTSACGVGVDPFPNRREIPPALGFRSLYAFEGESQGHSPSGITLASNGWLYGVAPYGGLNFGGVLYRIQLDGSGYQILHHFDTLTGTFPLAAPTEYLGYLYGATINFGAHSNGTLYRIALNGTGFEVLHDFSSSMITIGPKAPFTPLLEIGGKLYGVSTDGGDISAGAILKIEPSPGTAPVVLHSFSSGDAPSGSLVQLGGKICGVGGAGGANDNGFVYCLDLLNANSISTFSFNALDGTAYPQDLVVHQDQLFGLAIDPNEGTITKLFRLDGNLSTLTLLHTFDSNSQPQALLSIPGNSTHLYGSTLQGEQVASAACIGSGRTGANSLFCIRFPGATERVSPRG